MPEACRTAPILVAAAGPPRPGGDGAVRQDRTEPAQPSPAPPRDNPTQAVRSLGPSDRLSALECLERGLRAAVLAILCPVGKEGMKQTGTSFSRDFYVFYKYAYHNAHTLKKVKSKECSSLSQ